MIFIWILQNFVNFISEPDSFFWLLYINIFLLVTDSELRKYPWNVFSYLKKKKKKKNNRLGETNQVN